MSFRKEIKLKIVNSKIFEFKNYLMEKNFFTQYPDRLVTSIYFDNDKFDMYKDSIEGSIPRKKIRIRSYDSNKKFYLEKKISSLENRFKISKTWEDYEKLYKYGIFDHSYGVCQKKIIVSYLRSYYIFKDFRVTIDKNIEFGKFGKFKNRKLESSNIVEVKCSTKISNEKIFKMFPFEQVRFSKYAIGVEKFNLA